MDNYCRRDCSGDIVDEFYVVDECLLWESTTCACLIADEAGSCSISRHHLMVFLIISRVAQGDCLEYASLLGDARQD